MKIIDIKSFKNILINSVLAINDKMENAFCNLLIRLSLYDKYQPMIIKDYKNGFLGRDCYDRWDTIVPYLKNSSGSFLDMGCNIGFFTLKASEMGFLSYGIDVKRKNILIANYQKKMKNLNNVFFMDHKINMDTVEKLPSFDVVCILSVFHHWVRHYGAENAMDMMKVLSKKCRDVLIFETGQPDEINKEWAKKLKFISNNTKQWGEDFLKEIGFENVFEIGSFKSPVSSVNRSLFIAYK